MIIFSRQGAKTAKVFLGELSVFARVIIEKTCRNALVEARSDLIRASLPLAVARQPLHGLGCRAFTPHVQGRLSTVALVAAAAARCRQGCAVHFALAYPPLQHAFDGRGVCIKMECDIRQGGLFALLQIVFDIQQNHACACAGCLISFSSLCAHTRNPMMHAASVNSDPLIHRDE